MAENIHDKPSNIIRKENKINNINKKLNVIGLIKTDFIIAINIIFIIRFVADDETNIGVKISNGKTAFFT